MARKRDPLELNKREKDILKFIETELNENGYPPSVREIGKAVGLKSTATFVFRKTRRWRIYIKER